VRWWLDTRDKPALLWAFLEHFAPDAVAAFEGNLATLELESLPGAATQETRVLRRQCRVPRLDFVTVPVTPEAIGLLKQRLAAPGVFREGGPLEHAQIEHAGALVFLAGDHFHRECVSAFVPTPEHLLQRLVAAGVIRAYQAAA
jgi:hypothetical protein